MVTKVSYVRGDAVFILIGGLFERAVIVSRCSENDPRIPVLTGTYYEIEKGGVLFGHPVHESLLSLDKPNTSVKGSTADEESLLSDTGKLWDSFIALPEEHPMERQEFASAIHVIQGLLAMRLCRRSHPEIFPTQK